MTYSKEVYHWRKEHGICIKCGIHEAINSTRCIVCASDEAEKQKQKYYSMSQEERALLNKKKSNSAKALREERKRLGLCYRCGKPSYRSHSLCYEHFLYMKRYHKKVNDENRKGFSELGLCRICGEEVVPGKKHCAMHLEQKRESMRKASSHRKRVMKNDKGDNEI